MINWARMLADFGDAKVSYAQLARRTNIPRTTLMRYLWGSQPNHSHGERIIDEWCNTLHKKREEAPQIARYDANRDEIR